MNFDHEAFDTSTNNEGDYIFDELGLVINVDGPNGHSEHVVIY